MRKAGKRWILVSLAALVPPASAQLQWSGSLEIAHKVDVAQQEGEEPAHINRTLKGLSAFNLVRARLFADAELTENVAVLTTVLWDEELGHFDMEGAYVLMSKLAGHESVNLQVGKMATPYGRFASRSFAMVNPLIGTPLLYHYFSSVRGNNVPANAAQQLAWRDATTAGYQRRGLPTIYDSCWNTGVQLFGSTRHFAYAVALTKGALANPAARSNDGAQLVGRVGVQPSMGLQLGLSGAWGPYLDASAGDGPAFPSGKSVEDFKQLLFGLDAAYGIGRFEFTAEVMRNHFDVPNLAAGDDGLTNMGGYLESVVGLQPGLHWAARVGVITFGDIDDGSGVKLAWDYDITRLETGLEYYLTRDMHLKGVVQLNWRPDAPDDADHMLGAQLATSF
jgi:hypothetical protein